MGFNAKNMPYITMLCRHIEFVFFPYFGAYIFLQQVSLATEEEEAADLVDEVQYRAGELIPDAEVEDHVVGRVKELHQEGPAPHQGPARVHLR